MDNFVSYNASVVLGSPCEPLHSHAGLCHRKSSVAYTGSLPVRERRQPNAVAICLVHIPAYIALQ